MNESTENHRQPLLKTAQLYQSLKNRDLKVINGILQSDGDINRQISAEACVHPSLVGGTALHIAAFKNDIELFDLLLKNGADITIQNHRDGNTILHYVTDDLHRNARFVESILSAHINQKITTNPRNNKGTSHFHIACMTGNVEAVEFFLQNNAASVDEASNSGCTPLHIAMRFLRREVLELLLRHNANLYVRDAAGMTPLHALVEQRLSKQNDDEKCRQTYDDMLKLTLMRCTDQMFPSDHVGLTLFQTVCTLQDTSLVEIILQQTLDLDHRIAASSPLWPGYSALHFAARCNLRIVKILLDRGADLRVEDAEGVTPLDICLKNLTPGNALSMLALRDSWKCTTFSDGRTMLYNFVLAMRHPATFVEYLNVTCTDLNSRLPEDFPLWPSFTPLHLAVLLSADEDQAITRICLERGASVVLQDRRGRTPLILAFRARKMRTVGLLQLYCPTDLHDDEGLSHLHVACETNDSRMIVKGTRNVNIAYRGRESLGNVRPGATPLHVAIANGREEMVETLLDLRADCRAEDANGSTPLDWLLHVYPTLSEESRLKFRLLFSRQLIDADPHHKASGLTWLHVAVCFDYATTVKELLERGVKVDPAIDTCESEFWSEYVGCTPLHLAILRRSSAEIVQQLIANGADLLARRTTNGMTPLYEILVGNCDDEVKRRITTMIYQDNALLARLTATSGITILHVAAHRWDSIAIQLCFADGLDVDARVNDDCAIWPGCTPMHLLLMSARAAENKGQMDNCMKLFLNDGGADVTVKDARGDTPVHLVLRQESLDERKIESFGSAGKPQIYGCPSNYTDEFLADYTTTLRTLLKYHRNHAVNPVGSMGISHFHAACLVNSVEVIKKFIEHGVDVNHPVDPFAPNYAGESPLQLLVESSYGIEGTLDLLLESGANVAARDSHGDTVMHKMVRAKLACTKLLSKLASREGNVNVANVLGETPLEMVLKLETIPIDAMMFFKNHRCRINTYNPITGVNYIEHVVSSAWHKEPQLSAIAALTYTRVDEKGRNAVHHVVDTDEPTTTMTLENYLWFFRLFGRSVDCRDRAGLTALHLAAVRRNKVAIEALLQSGVDVNVVDSSGKSALVVVLELYRQNDIYEDILLKLARHVETLKALKIHVSSLNTSTIQRCSNRIRYFAANNVLNYHLTKELRDAKAFSIDGNLTLRDFVPDVGPVNDYALMAEAKQRRIDEGIRSFMLHDQRLPGLRGFIKLQYKKAIERVPLINSAVIAMNRLFWLRNLAMPYECVTIILGFMSNCCIANLIAAVNENDKRS